MHLYVDVILFFNEGNLSKLIFNDILKWEPLGIQILSSKTDQFSRLNFVYQQKWM